MKWIILFLTMFAGQVVSEKSNNKDVGPTLASIWSKTSSNSFSFSQFGSIISEKHILIEVGSGKIPAGVIITNRTELETIGVAYGVYDATKVSIGNIDYPKKLMRYSDDLYIYVALLEMEKIGCNMRLVCLPSFFDFNHKKPIIGSFIESGEIKTFDVSMIEKSRCDGQRNPDHKITDGSQLCIRRKTNTTSFSTLFQWFNPENKIWYLVGVQWFIKEPLVEIGAYNISYLKPWIQKTVEDGTLDALLSPC